MCLGRCVSPLEVAEVAEKLGDLELVVQVVVDLGVVVDLEVLVELKMGVELAELVGLLV